MKVRVECRDPEKRRIAKQATKLFLGRLLDYTANTEKLDVTVKFVPYKAVGGKDYHGWCEVLDSRPHNVFEITIANPLPEKVYLTTLAHECVHVYQFHTGLLSTGEVYGTWEGKRYHMQNLNYDLHPWEIDAHAQEPVLIAHYKDVFGG